MVAGLPLADLCSPLRRRCSCCRGKQDTDTGVLGRRGEEQRQAGLAYDLPRRVPVAALTETAIPRSTPARPSAPSLGWRRPEAPGQAPASFQPGSVTLRQRPAAGGSRGHLRDPAPPARWGGAYTPAGGRVQAAACGAAARRRRDRPVLGGAANPHALPLPLRWAEPLSPASGEAVPSAILATGRADVARRLGAIFEAGSGKDDGPGGSRRRGGGSCGPPGFGKVPARR